MISGRLKRRIRIEHIVTRRESLTGTETTQTEAFEARADVRWSAGARTNTGEEIVYSYDATFIVWLYLKERISMYDEIVYEGRRFVIESPEPDPEGRILYLRCRSK